MANRVVTRHAKSRIKTRVGVRNAEYNYKLAKRKGNKIYDFKGDFKKLLGYLEFKSKGKIIVYNSFIYITKFGKLITVLNVPNKYHNYKESLILE